ncbi:hypothetical protein MMC07_000774 [Pseudocyphellaria aurata]|nr:hypothetical protein [Pseudocyphellaria aurata]
MSRISRDDQNSNNSMYMNSSKTSLKNFLPEQSSRESQRDYKVNGIREKLDELECQQSRRQTNGQGFGMMRYLQDANASEAFAVGTRDESMAASNKDIAMKANLKAWEVRFKELSKGKEEK